MTRIHFRITPFGVVTCESGRTPLVTELKGDEADEFRAKSAKTVVDRIDTGEAGKR